MLLLGACGGGGAQQVTVSPGVSTVAGQVPSMALRSPAAIEAPAADEPAEPAQVLVATAPVPPATPAVSAAAPASSTAAPEVGVLYGVVTRSGQAVAGARMTLKAGDGTERETTTDSTGTYRFSGVPAGAYELGTYAESGASCADDNCISAAWLERTELTLAVGETRRLDVNGD